MDTSDLTMNAKFVYPAKKVALTSSQFNFPLLKVVKNQMSIFFFNLKYVLDYFKFTNLSRFESKKNDKYQELKI